MRITSIRAVLVTLFALLGTSPLYAQASYPIPGGGSYPAANAPGVPWLEGWAGFGGSNNWYGGWAGFNYAFNHNVWSEGLLLRGEGGGGHYDYTQPTIFHGSPIDGGFVNATYGTGAVLLGWRHYIPGVGVSTHIDGFVGVEYQNQNNPDPTADVRGTEWGAKFIGDIYSRLSQYQDFFGMASFSFAFDTWLVLARPGFLLTQPGGIEWWIGPDLQAFGNGHGFLQDSSGCNGARTSGGLASCKYDEGRIGGFVHLVIPNNPLWGDWIVAGGYRKPLLANGGGDGYYAQIGWNFRFQ
jgi:Cellulose biosynthesis protein BcsS